jgi:hypothetical protein
MDFFGQGQDRPTSAAVRFNHQRPLLSDRALGGGVIERDHCGHRRAEMPGNFGAAMVEARVVSIEHQLHVVSIDAELPFELVERGPRVPQADEIRTS